MSSSFATTTSTSTSNKAGVAPTSSTSIISSPPSTKRGPALTISVQALHKPVKPKPKAKDIIMASRALQQQQQQDYDRAQDIARQIMDDHDHAGNGRVNGYGTAYEQEEDLMLDEHGGAHHHHHSRSRQQQAQQQGQQGQIQLHYVDEDGQDHHGDDDGPDHDEEDLDEDSGSFSDSLSSSPSIPDEDIDFTLVYALHTFLATVDGQASVVKGDKLLLLDDSNSYWWLVRVLKTQAVGYIPAENIETPWERLARLNKHLNVDLTTATQQDVLSGPRSTMAQTRFQTRIPPSQQPHPHMSQHPSAKGVIASPSHKDHPCNISPPSSTSDAGRMRIERSHSSKAKTVGFTAPTYYEHSANGDSDTYDEEDGEETGSGEQDYEEEDDEMSQDGEHGQQPHHHHHRRRRRNRDDDEGELMGDQVFEDHDEDEDEEEETSEFSDDHHEQSQLQSVQAPIVATNGGGVAREAHNVHQTVHHQESHGHVGEVGTIEDAPLSEDKTLTVKKRYSASDLGNIEPGMNLYQLRSPDGSLNQDALASKDGGNLSPLVAPTTTWDSTRESSPHPSLAPLEDTTNETDPFVTSRRPSAATSTSSGNESGSIKGRAVNLDVFEPDAPTKKVSATPPIVRDPNFDINDPFGDLQKPRGISNTFVSQPRTTSSTSRSQSTPVVEVEGSKNGTTGVSSPNGGVQISPVRVRGVEVVNVNDPRYDRLIGPAKRLHQENALRSNSVDTSPRPQSPNEGFVAKGSLGQGDVSLNSMDTISSYATSGAGHLAEENGRSYTPNSIVSETGSGKGKVKISGSAGSAGRDSVDGGGGGNEEANGGKKRKSGGILGLFRKKDKKKKNSSLGSLNASDEGHGIVSGGGGARSSEESNRIASPVQTGSGTSSGSRTKDPSRRESQTVDTLFSTDAALRQQQVEAKQAMYHQYGVQRAPGDVSNTMTPRAGPGSVALAPQGSQQSISATAVRMRPGSLLGSPSIPGLDVPLLSVLRIFAGDHVDSEATFKTVLLNRATTTHDLVKQAMQRFRLTGDAEIDEYYLTVRELGGEERVIGEQVRPLTVFETMSEAAEQGFIVPSVKRSSIGSITSIQSNLSLNPAITRLGMNDWSDDSAVKFYLNRRRPRTRDASLHGTLAKLEASSTTSPIDKDGSSTTAVLSPSSDRPETKAGLLSVDLTASASPSFRFAARITIHPQDLPETVVFDPQSNAIIPRSVLSDRRNIGLGVEPISPDERERIVFFPRNANVSEVIEAGLDRFGIVDGVVDGGDEVEDRVSKRRSVSRVKYALAVEKDGHETLLHSSSKLIDAYPIPPLLKSYDRTSREFRRRSVDATLILGSEQDLQPTDPVFVLRRAAYRGPASRGVGPIPVTIDELEERQQKRAFAEHQTASDPRAPSSSGHSPTSVSTSSTTQQARSLLSARQNDEQGVDIAIPERGTIRSIRADGGRVRYSFIGPNGQSTDISDLVDREFAPAAPAATTPSGSLHPGLGDRSVSQASRTTNHTTTDSESFHTAKESDSIYSTGNASSSTLNAAQAAGAGDEESNALRALRTTDIRIDTSVASPVSSSPALRSPTFNSRSLGAASALRQAATAGQSPRVASPLGTQETDDVLQGAFGSRRAMSPAFNESLQERLDRVLAKVKEDKLRGRVSPALRPPSWAAEHQRGVSGSSTPTVRAVSPSGPNVRLSPGGQGGSPSIEQVVSLGASTSNQAPFTSATPTPTTHDARSTNAPTKAQTGALYYHDDFGLDTMFTLVNEGARSITTRKPRTSSLKRPQGHEALFGPSLRDLDLSEETMAMYAPQTRRLDELESRLDALLLRLRIPNPESRLETSSSPSNAPSPSLKQHPS
ncbi:BZ3500_MvSof-1268-A1-R1_Chr6-1g08390 [Microbotryum saponariae]|uniref:BZ3500_MvSof-1268-A1-R1_Chr6-1g08390 protein n=1 Tax=Microbotryum saponariae TaxID=289078 RepID=A0A2X0LKN6_9BASI|nr:BZ3500_MvSof-1268-A1-R1_Chr6-1g08390 [Microbotryum saponariae]SDA07674.1 BZ3501_MvSof-1269-A2-R1_Chr6-1g08111 [Microbotryum saponariae]